MSINFIKSIVEAQDVKLSSSKNSVGIEFNKKFTYFSFVKKYIEKQVAEKKKVIVINYDLLFYRYVLNQRSKKSGEIFKNTSNLTISNIFSLREKSLPIDLNLSGSGDKNSSSASLLIIGLDLIPEKNIHNFFHFNKKLLNQANYSIFLFSLDSSSNNLNEQNERKKEIIKNRLNYYVYEKMNRIYQNKNLLYMEVYNLAKLTRDIAIFEFGLNNKSQGVEKLLPIELYEFEKISIFLKEYKDLFESNVDEDSNGNSNTTNNLSSEPMSTFKLTLNDKELQAKNEVVLPYLKMGSEKDENRNGNRIIIDQDDLNELYEEDPDGDLDI